MICYVILHYLSISETLKCVFSIKQFMHSNNKIIIVDNNSPNNSGVLLVKQYLHDEQIDVILNTDNMGYARGNNVGYSYAKKTYHPDYIIIINNDVEILDREFERRIFNVYKNEKFDVLGPDIYSTSYRLHQSPKRLNNYSLEEVKKLNSKFTKELNKTYKLKFRCAIKKSLLLRKIIYQIRRKKIDFSKRYYNVPLHGACVIFSSNYIKRFDIAFYPKTFFYYEMEILDFICKNEKLIEIYEPTIKVLHHQNVSTNIAYSNLYEKTVFSYKSNIQATKVFAEFIENINDV